MSVAMLVVQPETSPSIPPDFLPGGPLPKLIITKHENMHTLANMQRLFRGKYSCNTSFSFFSSRILDVSTQEKNMYMYMVFLREVGSNIWRRHISGKNAKPVF